MLNKKKILPNLLIIVVLAFGVLASVGGASAAPLQGDGTPFILLSPADSETGLNPDDVWLQWANYEATEFWKYSYCIDEKTEEGVSCETGDPNWTGTYNRQYVNLNNLQPNTEYFWRVKVVRCEVADCTEKSHIISFSDHFYFTTGPDNWLKISGKAGNKSGILVNFYDDGTESGITPKTYSIMTGANGYYTISIPFGYNGVGYPRMNPSEWTYEDPIYDTRFEPSFRYYTNVEQNLTEQNFLLKDQLYVAGKTDIVAGVEIEFIYTGKFFDNNGDEILDTDPEWADLQESYTFTTFSDTNGNYKQYLPKEWIGTIQISAAYSGANPYAPAESIDRTNFDPWYYSLPQLTSSKDGYNFYLNQVKISGHTDGLEGIDVTFDGTYVDYNGVTQDFDDVVTTDVDGYYFLYTPKGWQGTISVPDSVVVGPTTYYFSPTTYSLPQVMGNTYGWNFFKTTVDPTP